MPGKKIFEPAATESFQTEPDPGQVVFSQRIKEALPTRQRIDMKACSPGVYLLRACTSEKENSCFISK